MSYQKKKENARNRIMDTLDYIRQNPVSWDELANYQTMFEKLAFHYGLVTELKENGVI